ncbi:MAG: hypothetical protein KKD44_19275 [Proteobacteria bacterium]|nr:hypothetical protein [Pseudomonadota bacterium]
MKTVGIIGGIGPESTIEYYRLIIVSFLQHEKYMGELVKGIIRDDTKKELLKIAHGLKERKGIEALILGGDRTSPDTERNR